MNDDKVIKIKIMGYQDRQAVLSALAHNGYAVWVEEKNDYPTEKIYYVCFYLI